VTHMRESILCYVFDDSFDHEACHDGVRIRIVRELSVCVRESS